LRNPKFLFAASNPGCVQTDMGNGAAKGVGMEGALTTLDDSVKGLIALFDVVSLEKTGTFTGMAGDSLPW
jgi:norsolorinic acid ketoreductase